MLDVPDPPHARGPRPSSAAIADSPASGQLAEGSLTDTVTAVTHVAVAAEPGAQSAQPPLTAVQLALHTGWTMAVLYGKISAPPAEGFPELPTAHELPPAERRELELKRLRHLLQNLAHLPGFTESGLPTEIPAKNAYEAVPQDMLRELNLAILAALAATQPETLLAYELGIALRDTVNPPVDPAGRQTPAPLLARQLARGRIAELQEWLAILSTQFPQHVAAIVAASLGHWSDLAAVRLRTPTTRLEKRDSADVATKMREYLLPQGDLWLMLLTGTYPASGLLSPEGYVAAARVALARSATIIHGVLRHYWAALLILAIAVAGTLYLALNNLGGSARVWTAIAAIGGCLGISAKTIASATSRLVAKAERPVFAMAEEDAMAWAITSMPAVRRTSRGVQWLIRGPHRAGGSGVGRAKVSRAKDRPQSAQSWSSRTHQIGSSLVDLLSSAPSSGRSPLRRTVAAGAAAAVAAGSGVATGLTGVTTTLSLAVSLGVLAVTVVALEGAVTASERRSHDHSRKQAADSWGQATDGGGAEEVPVREHPGSAHEASEVEVAARPTPPAPGREEAPGLHPPTREREKDVGPGDRYLVGRVKEEVEAGREFFLSLQVKVNRPEPAAGVSQSHMLVDRSGDLLAVLVADPLFSVLTPDKVIVPVPQEGEGPEKGFTLRPQHAGAGWLHVDVHRGTQALTTFRFRVTASKARRESETQSAAVGIPRTSAPSGLMKILLTGRKEPTIQLLVGETHLDDHPLGTDQSELREQLQKITAQLNAFSDSTARGSISKKREELHGLGKQIYNHLLPGPFVEEFREHRPSATSLDIQGRSPLPWELMADSDDDTFLAEELRVTRWLNGSQPGAPIRLGNAIFACTEGVDGAKKEIEEIGQLLCPGQDPAIIGQPEELQQRMKAGDFYLFHFAGHTKEDKSQEAAALDFGNDVDYTLNYMANVPSKRLERSRPVIFLNACGSASGIGRQTLFEHWAEEFIKLGAGAFIGSLWNIRSETANTFGTDVYRSIREGAASTLGEAVDFARRNSTIDPSDPTRLAYALYGRDNAQVILTP